MRYDNSYECTCSILYGVDGVANFEGYFLQHTVLHLDLTGIDLKDLFETTSNETKDNIPNIHQFKRRIVLLFKVCTDRYEYVIHDILMHDVHVHVVLVYMVVLICCAYRSGTL